MFHVVNYMIKLLENFLQQFILIAHRQYSDNLVHVPSFAAENPMHVAIQWFTDMANVTLHPKSPDLRGSSTAPYKLFFF